MNPELKLGDFWLEDSDRTQAKIVKFFMQEPTFLSWLYHKIFGHMNEVRFYHAGIVISPTIAIEQQKVVQITDTQDIFNTKRYIVWRYKHLTKEQAQKLKEVAAADLGKEYDWLLVLGKTMTWLTGIKWFQRHMELKGKEICINRVIRWFFSIGVTFGLKYVEDGTTDIVDDYCSQHPEDWEIAASHWEII